MLWHNLTWMQKKIVCVGSVLIVGLALFPPYDVQSIVGPYRFVLIPPDRRYYGYSPIVWPQYLIPIIIVFLATIVGLVLAWPERKPPKPSDDGLYRADK